MDRDTIVEVLAEAQEIFFSRIDAQEISAAELLDLLFEKYDVNVDDPFGSDGY